MTAPEVGRPAVFLDRDGTLMHDTGYPGDAEVVRLVDGVPEALRAIEDAGYLRIVITNQSGIGRGIIRPDDFAATQRALLQQLAEAGASIDAALHCPHAPDAGCTCRKPGTALHREAAARFGVDLARSWCIGDRLRDVQPANELGCRGILLIDDETIGDGPPASALGALLRRDLGASVADLPRYLRAS